MVTAQALRWRSQHFTCPRISDDTTEPPQTIRNEAPQRSRMQRYSVPSAGMEFSLDHDREDQGWPEPLLLIDVRRRSRPFSRWPLLLEFRESPLREL